MISDGGVTAKPYAGRRPRAIWSMPIWRPHGRKTFFKCELARGAPTRLPEHAHNFHLKHRRSNELIG
jgi:hypothetical protein